MHPNTSIVNYSFKEIKALSRSSLSLVTLIQQMRSDILLSDEAGGIEDAGIYKLD
jgi:hypothetical protein